MFKTLLKKEMMEIFRGYFYNSKKNQARSKGSTIAYFILFFFLIIVVIGGIFTGLSFALCPAMAKSDMSWLYFAIMGLLAIVMGTFGSVFNTYSGLYLAKDNDLLLSMPIPVSMIMATRLLGVYIMSFIYSGMVIIPAVIVYLLTVSASINAIIGCILFVLLISVFVLTLSCALGWVVAKISLKLKNKSFITVLISLLFFGAYYVLYFKSQSIIENIAANAVKYGTEIKEKAYPVYAFGSVGVGDFLSMLIVSAVVIALFAIMWIIISRSFIKIATSSGSGEKRKYKRTAVKQMSTDKALFFKELKRFTSSSAYMLNCGLGIVLLPVFGVVALLSGSKMFSVFSEIFGQDSGFVPLFLCTVLCAIVSMIDITAPSVSLEGKTIWLAQSLPIKPWQVLKSKLMLQVVLSVIPTLLCTVILAFSYPFSAVEMIFIIIMPILFILLSAQFGLFLGIKMANLNWTNEIMPIKQSACVFIAVFCGLGYSLLMLFGYFIVSIFLRSPFAFALYMSTFAALTALFNIILYRWLKKKGSAVFASL